MQAASLSHAQAINIDYKHNILCIHISLHMVVRNCRCIYIIVVRIVAFHVKKAYTPMLCSLQPAAAFLHVERNCFLHLHVSLIHCEHCTDGFFPCCFSFQTFCQPPLICPAQTLHSIRMTPSKGISATYYFRPQPTCTHTFFSLQTHCAHASRTRSHTIRPRTQILKCQ